MRSVWSLTSELTIAAGVLILCAVWTFGPSGKCEEEKSGRRPLRHFEILQSLQSSVGNNKAAESTSGYLIDEVRTRGVDFALYEALAKEIKKFGGSDDLLAVIDASIPSERKPRLREVARLDKIIRDNYYRNSTLRMAIDAGKEFLEKYPDEPGYCEMIEWIRSQMPNWKRRIEHWERSHWSRRQLDTQISKS